MMVTVRTGQEATDDISAFLNGTVSASNNDVARSWVIKTDGSRKELLSKRNELIQWLIDSGYEFHDHSVAWVKGKTVIVISGPHCELSARTADGTEGDKHKLAVAVVFSER